MGYSSAETRGSRWRYSSTSPRPITSGAPSHNTSFGSDTKKGSRSKGRLLRERQRGASSRGEFVRENNKRKRERETSGCVDLDTKYWAAEKRPKETTRAAGLASASSPPSAAIVASAVARAVMSPTTWRFVSKHAQSETQSALRQLKGRTTPRTPLFRSRFFERARAGTADAHDAVDGRDLLQVNRLRRSRTPTTLETL